MFSLITAPVYTSREDVVSNILYVFRGIISFATFLRSEGTNVGETFIFHVIYHIIWKIIMPVHVEQDVDLYVTYKEKYIYIYVYNLLPE